MSSSPNSSTIGGPGNLVLWITYLNIVLYALCYQLQRPVEPFLVESLTKDHNDPDQVSIMYGRLQSFFSAIQTVGSPLVGILLDRIGVRKASTLVFLASAASYAILACASSMELLFLSKVPTALQHAFLVAQAAAAISCGSNTAARAAALGRMTTAYTIGGTIGPALGGFMAQQDLYMGARLAVFGSLVSVVLSLLFLPDASAENNIHATASKSNRSFIEECQNSIQLAMRSNLWPLLLVKIVGGFSASMHSTALPLVLKQQLNFDPSQLGLTMSSSMFAVATFGAFCMAPLAQSLGTHGMGQTGLALRAGFACVLALLTTSVTTGGESVVMKIVVVSVLHALASHILSTGVTTQTTGAVSKSEQGTLLGLEHGLFSLARVGGPTTGTSLLAAGGFWSVAVACGSIDFALVGLMVGTASQTTYKPVAKPDDEHSD